jgi:hypothetical protein
MEPNERISIHRSSESLHLKLLGEFDDTLARELLELLQRDGFGAQRVFIHTSSLRSVLSFSKEWFHENLSQLNGQAMRILFTGEKASQLAPEKELCM